jgi:hypothetical protein
MIDVSEWQAEMALDNREGRFTQSEPARSVLEVMEFLEAQGRGHYVYRGQTKCYKSILPSAYRRLCSPSGKMGQWDVNVPAFFSTEPNSVQGVKDGYLGGLIKQDGVALGNLFAQQYGISAECIDVTSSVTMAGYFASHKHPEYKRYIAQSGELGVIYRFPAESILLTKNQLENMFRYIYGARALKGKRVLMGTYLKPHEHHLMKKEDIFEGKKTGRGPLLTASIMVEPDLMKHLFIEFLKESPAMTSQEAAASAENTRVLRQKAGTFKPSFVWDCEMGEPADYTLVPHLDIYYRDPPAVVLAHRLKQITDMYYKPGREGFYFRHDPEKAPSFSREHLWPGMIEDRVFRYIFFNAASIISARAKPKDEHELEDIIWKVIDRGYAS